MQAKAARKSDAPSRRERLAVFRLRRNAVRKADEPPCCDNGFLVDDYCCKPVLLAELFREENLEGGERPAR